MTMASTAAAGSSAAARRHLLPLWVGLGIYGFLLVVGNQLLNDPDTLFHVTLGQWMIDNRAVPTTDSYSFTFGGQPWISMEWVSQVMYATSYNLAGWTGPVVLAAAALALTFALYARFLGARLTASTTMVFVAAALALMVPHMLARPHVMAMPVMVAWIGGLVAAMDRREAPSLWLLPLIALWANLHGGFVLGIALVAPMALDVLLAAPRAARLPLALRWGGFGVLALAAGCLTPYGWNSLLAPLQLLSLGKTLALITEWRPADFSSIGALELTLLFGLGLSLWRGITLPPVRILMLLGLVHMALTHERYLEVLALLAPLILAAPLASQIGAAEPAGPRAKMSRALVAAVALLLIAGTAAIASLHRYQPHATNSPVAAVAELKTYKLARVLNDYDFGCYLIANGVAPFVDGRSDLYGDTFMVMQDKASRLKDPQDLFTLLDDYRIEATLLRTSSPASKMLDHVDGWQKVYADDIAVIHLRKPGARHSAEPRIFPAGQ